MIYLQYIFLYLTIILASNQPVNAQSKQLRQSEKTKQPIVFITGFDEGDNQYYANAQQYFETKGFNVITDKYALSEIIEWLNVQDKEQLSSEIHIVSHSNPWRGLSMKTLKEGNRITVESLMADQEKIPVLDSQLVGNLNIIFHSCGLGENIVLLEILKAIIDPTHQINLYASPYFNIFGSPYAPHYLADFYYVFYPTANSPGRWELAKELSTTYPEKELNWQQALHTKREEKIGKPYRYRFNIPIYWETIFENEGAIPELNSREAIMNWVAEEEALAMHIFELNIPLEKFRWKREIKGNKLIIKGKTTVQCVLEPITLEKDRMEYSIPNYTDTDLYVKI
jgi:hypothetical protein